ncbi:hypothetical protein B0H17DRAFT_1186154 [Mycena rosella]|uniref:DUF6534 domain-containing protein n=1 Tax=Mycena rosella TaxID=1033263 RepID=A0AAD7G0J5_MYCRO|nr:hypothetical protein B0H17DRAFT_1186154 [Mycena rosella]
MSQYVLLTGPILAGTQFNWALLGTLTLQVYIFHVSFPKERAWLKALVYTIFVLDVAQTAIASHFAYALLVNGWGDPTALTHLPWSSAAVPIFTGLISAAVQIFFAWRIYALKGENPFALAISVLIVMLALMQCFSAIISDALFSVTTELSEITKLMAGVKVWLIGSAVCDIVITFTMIVILSQYQQKTPWKKTDSMITKLIYSTVETGAITSVVAILDVVLFILFPNNYLHEAPAFMLGKVYSNVLLATLNQRARVSAGVTATGNFASDDTELQWRRQTITHEPEAQKVHITTVTEINSDRLAQRLRNVHKLDSKMRRPRGPDF